MQVRPAHSTSMSAASISTRQITRIGIGNLAAKQSVFSTGSSLQIQATDGAGNITSGTIRHADGSRDVYTSAPAGASYATEHDLISASGITTLLERFYADGDFAF